MLLAAGFFASAAVATTWLFTLSDIPVRWYVLGLVHAGLAATLLHMLNSAVFAHDRTAIFQLRGSWGEDNTRTVLSSAKRRRVIWGWVDSISLQAGDLDHVVITRAGGIVVLDSKWRSEVTAAGVAEMAASAKRAKLRAEGLSRTLLTINRSGKHRASAQSVSITPAIVLWGAARATVPDGHQVDGVHFVDGQKLVAWLKTLTSGEVSKEASADLLTRLSDFRSGSLKAIKARTS